MRSAVIMDWNICHSCPSFAGTIQSPFEAAAGVCCSITISAPPSSAVKAGISKFSEMTGSLSAAGHCFRCTDYPGGELPLNDEDRLPPYPIVCSSNEFRR
jgi:hypothetical protein